LIRSCTRSRASEVVEEVLLPPELSLPELEQLSLSEVVLVPELEVGEEVLFLKASE